MNILLLDRTPVDTVKVSGFIVQHDFVALDSCTHFGTTCIDLSECKVANDSLPKGTFAFSNIEEFKFPRDTRVIGNSFFYESKLKHVDIPSTVRHIDYFAFMKCYNLDGEVVIPEGVTKIKDYTFSYCHSIDRISLPNSLKEIWSHAFSDIYNYDIDLVLPQGLEKLCSHAFFCFWGFQGKEFTIPESVHTIEPSVFVFADVKKVNLPDHIESIPMSFFRESKIEEIDFPKSLVTIDDYAFQYCELLKEAILPEKVKSIGMEAFYYNSALTRVVLPAGIETIGEESFAECPMLNDFYVKAVTPPTVKPKTFDRQGEMTLYVPVGAKEAYAAADHWKDFGEIVEVEEFPSAGREAVIAGGGNAARAFGAQGAAVIEGEGARYAIFTTDGREVASGIADGRTEVPLPQGIYVARTGSASHRIAVR